MANAGPGGSDAQSEDLKSAVETTLCRDRTSAAGHQQDSAGTGRTPRALVGLRQS